MATDLSKTWDSNHTDKTGNNIIVMTREEKADKSMIDKACKWLRWYLSDYVFVVGTNEWLHVEDMIDDFKKAMEE